MKLNVYATPDSVSDKELKDKTAVIIDVLRATSTILAALANGCKEVIPAVEVEEVIAMSKNYEKDSFLLCGERNIQPVEGFHLSNSPLEYTEEQVSGKSLLMTTTNGTRAVRRAMDAKDVIICSLSNVDAVAEYLAEQEDDAAFICAGTDGQFSLDDIVTAGAVIHRLRDRVEHLDLGDLAVVSEYMYKQCADDLHKVIKHSLHYKRMMECGLADDIEYCLTLNAAPIVAVYKDGVIKKLDGVQA
ncbi:MAG: 2-phosphosulfolactate phosphatase [Caldicoprobacterales bacterium]|jgi:2-phosphosulfolactate phosphatase|nr:2-phosphosulfolactate phosphatase [Clostridiales bacterium]